MSQIVADRYAEALFQLATELDLVDRLDQELTVIAQTLAENAELRLLVEHPLVARADKKSVAVKLFERHVHELTLNFLQLLFDKGRGGALELIQSRYHHLASRLQKRLVVQVTTAVPIPNEDVEKFRERLEKAWDRLVEIEPHIDPAVLGGARMKVEDQVVDGSLKGALDKLRQDMMRSA
ncbi:MAG: ATP synthase F1 subunit delta [Candidatus Sericytochromatia bacterium]|nr:ATP synthase F1 subunit delta [Candidatus Tanganyikabacteria bacterium]